MITSLRGRFHGSEHPWGDTVSSQNVPRLIFEPHSGASLIHWRCPLQNTKTSSTWKHPLPPPLFLTFSPKFFIVCALFVFSVYSVFKSWILNQNFWSHSQRKANYKSHAACCTMFGHAVFLHTFRMHAHRHMDSSFLGWVGDVFRWGMIWNVNGGT